MTQRNNQLRNAHVPHTAARAAASPLVSRYALVTALAISTLITVLVLITGPLSAEYGFV